MCQHMSPFFLRLTSLLSVDHRNCSLFSSISDLFCAFGEAGRGALAGSCGMKGLKVAFGGIGSGGLLGVKGMMLKA